MNSCIPAVSNRNTYRGYKSEKDWNWKRKLNKYHKMFDHQSKVAYTVHHIAYLNETIRSAILSNYETTFSIKYRISTLPFSIIQLNHINVQCTLPSSLCGKSHFMSIDLVTFSYTKIRSTDLALLLFWNVSGMFNEMLWL